MMFVLRKSNDDLNTPSTTTSTESVSASTPQSVVQPTPFRVTSQNPNLFPSPPTSVPTSTPQAQIPVPATISTPAPMSQPVQPSTPPTPQSSPTMGGWTPQTKKQAIANYMNRPRNFINSTQPLNSPQDVMKWLQHPEAQAQLEHAFTLGTMKPSFDQIEHLKEGSDYAFRYHHPKTGQSVTDYALWRYNNPTDHALKGSLEAVTVPESQRGGDFTYQWLLRHEDVLRDLTKNFPDEHKHNVSIDLIANGNGGIGRYQWARHGFSYLDNDERAQHIRSLMRALKAVGGPGVEADILKLPHGERVGEPNDRTPRMVQDAQGREKSIYDMGYSPERLKQLYSTLHTALQQARDQNVPDEEKIEPWELFHLDEKEDPKLYKNGHQSSLMKWLLIHGFSWMGTKPLYPTTEKRKRALLYGDKQRVARSHLAEHEGNGWEVLKYHG